MALRSSRNRSRRKSSCALNEPFYSLADPLLSRPFRAESQGAESFRLLASVHAGEVHQPERPLVVQYSSGGQPSDFIWDSTIPLIHQRVVDVLATANLKGWQAVPVTVLNRRGDEISDYYVLAVTGRCKSLLIDAEHSQTVMVEYPTGLYPKLKGLFVEPEHGDVPDIFKARDRLSGWTVVSLAFARTLSAAQIQNVKTIPVSEVMVTPPWNIRGGDTSGAA